MSMRTWWEQLDETTQVWLLQNSDTEMPPAVSAAVAAVGGPAQLSDDDLAWLEEVNNGGSPA